MQAAAEEAGLDDFGDAGFVEPLTRMCEAMVTEADLNTAGVFGQRLGVQRMLVNRLRFQRDLTLHPEILDEVVDDPIVITGLPRTGTTKLQRVLAMDPRLQYAPFWRLYNPAPYGPAADSGEDPRIGEADGFLALMRAAAPDAVAGHPMETHAADEEVFLMDMNFDAHLSALRLRAPEWHAWVWSRPRAGTYGFLRAMVQYLQWQDGGRRDRPWVLKSPAHLGGLPELLEAFPRATVVYCHRPLAAAVPSAIRLGEVFRTTVSDNVDPKEMAGACLPFFAREWTSCLEHRQRVPAERIVDVEFESVREDIVDVVNSIYERRSWGLDPELSRRIATWEDENPSDKYGAFRYSLERYDITEAEIYKAFEPYCDFRSGRV